jgi:hypothetical protein
VVASSKANTMGRAFGVGTGIFRALTQVQFGDTPTFPIYPRTVVAKIGICDEALHRNQDNDLNFRLKQIGGKILFRIRISTE